MPKSLDLNNFINLDILKWMKLYCVLKILFVTFMSDFKNLNTKPAGAGVRLVRFNRSRNKWWKVTCHHGIGLKKKTEIIMIIMLSLSHLD